MTAGPLDFLADEVAALRSQHLYRDLRVLTSAQGPVVEVDGRRLISLSSNDYLGLTHHPRLRAAAEAAVAEFGVGSGAVRTIAGTMSMHQALEAELAEFKQVPAVLTFQSGFTANTGLIPTITGEHDLIVSDSLNHASIIDGVRLSKASRKVYPHADVAALKAVLDEAVAEGKYRLILVATDGVFSMDGDIAPLPAIVEAAEAAGAAVLVDDAHGSGVLGRDGRGTVDHFGLHGRVHIQVGTLSKAIGSLGGYVAGPTALREILTQRARPFLFSTSHPPAVVAACREAIRVMQDEPELQTVLWSNTRRFKAELAGLGFDTGVSETPITPVMMGDPETAMRFSDRLTEEGIFAQPVVFPTVALDKARIRTIVTAAHTDAHLDQALDAFARVGRELGLLVVGDAGRAGGRGAHPVRVRAGAVGPAGHRLALLPGAQPSRVRHPRRGRGRRRRRRLPAPRRRLGRSLGLLHRERCDRRPSGKEGRMSDQQATGTSDPTYNVIAVVYHALQGAETIQKYLDDQGTDDELRQFFQQVQQGYRRAADMGKNLLVQRIEHEH